MNRDKGQGLGCSISAKIMAMTPEKRKEFFDKIRRKLKEKKRK